MKIVLCGDIDDAELFTWRQHLLAAMPEAEWLCAEAAREAAGEVRAAVVANPRPGSLQGFPRLGLVQSLWAGVDRLVADPTLPAGVPLARMVDPAMNAAMAETATWAVLALHRGFFVYQARQREGVWRVHAQRRADEVAVTVLGGGQMGGAVLARLQPLGYRLAAWTRSGGVSPVPGVRVLCGQAGLESLLPVTDVVINLLPLTGETRSLIDARFLAALPDGASLVNLARGAHVVDEDLLAALDSGRLAHAVLDVFRQEPLPATHGFWRHPRVTVLPHAAALTDPRSAAAVVAANLRALRDGLPPAHLVDRARGY
jgi:glyoxylate/hydroxypyruvate reductase A